VEELPWAGGLSRALMVRRLPRLFAAVHRRCHLSRHTLKAVRPRCADVWWALTPNHQIGSQVSVRPSSLPGNTSRP
jgi:hypothetical protein